MATVISILVTVWIPVLGIYILAYFIKNPIIRSLLSVIALGATVVVLVITIIVVALGGLSFLDSFTSGSYKAKRVYTDGNAIGNSCYRIYRGRVYAVFKSGSEFVRYRAAALDVNPKEFEVYPGLVCAGHDDSSVFIAQFKLPDADPNTFRSVQINMFNGIFADKHRLYKVKGYPLEVRAASYITTLEDDPSIVRVLDNFGYMIGDKYVYYQGEVLEGITPQYVQIPAWGVGDSLGVFGTKILIAFDPQNNVAYCGESRIEVDIGSLRGYMVTPQRGDPFYMIGDGSRFYNKWCWQFTLDELQSDGQVLPLR